MIREEFLNKKIAFLAASITENGRYINDIRSYLLERGENPMLFNRAIGGTRAVMAKSLLDEEIFLLKPDIVFFTYGVNDMGIWLYDSLKEETAELLAKREARDKECFESMRYLIEKMQAKGIRPIIMTPPVVNELLIEKDDIETVTDNKEKEDYIGPSFYKKATFKKINKAIKYYAETYKKFAKEYKIDCVDLTSLTYEGIYANEGLMRDDGIHYTEKGHDYMAKGILKFMGAEDIPETFKDYEVLNQAREWEKKLRSVMDFRRPVLLPESVWPKTTDEDVLKALKAKLGDTTYWNYKAVPKALEWYEKRDELRKLEYEALTTILKK